MNQETLLDEIVAHKRLEVEALKRAVPQSALRALLENTAEARNFGAALKAIQPAVIAEIKKASPSKGLIRKDFNAADIAVDYEHHGAACLSVLTDERFFQGSNAALRAARSRTQLPVLRKDFIVDEYQIFETRALPADCLLLIVAVLDSVQLKSFHDIAEGIGLSVLVEIHDEAELELALSINARLIGINNRNLKTFETNLAVTEKLVSLIPPSVQTVSESGIRTRDDVARLRAQGVHAFLVGEALMSASKPGQAMREIFTLIKTTTTA